MGLENGTAEAVVKHLHRLGIADLAEWDVLAFIYRHGASLASADRISLLLGYSKAAVGSALDSLTAKGLVQRSRKSGGLRLYRMAGAAPDELQQRSLEELMKVAEAREGRLLLVNHLRHARDTRDLREHGGLHLA